MSANAQVVFTPPTLPDPYCFTTWQAFVNTFVSGLTGYLPGNFSTFNYGNSEPSVDNRDKPWIRTDTNNVIDRIYTFGSSYGMWVAPNPEPASSSARRLWVGTLAELQTYDGGNSDPVTDASGPMWEEDTDFQAKSFMHPGTLTVLGPILVNQNYGEEVHTLLPAETPKHTHDEMGGDADQNAIAGGGATRRTFGVAGLVGTPISMAMATASYGGAADGSTTPHNTVHPVRGIYTIKRTARIYYRAT